MRVIKGLDPGIRDPKNIMYDQDDIGGVRICDSLCSLGQTFEAEHIY